VLSGVQTGLLQNQDTAEKAANVKRGDHTHFVFPIITEWLCLMGLWIPISVPILDSADSQIVNNEAIESK
jgi:hypothetical protein